MRKERIDHTRDTSRELSIEMDMEGNYLLEEIVQAGKKTKIDVIWLTNEEIEEIHNYKMKQTGERS